MNVSVCKQIPVRKRNHPTRASRATPKPSYAARRAAAGCSDTPPLPATNNSDTTRAWESSEEKFIAENPHCRQILTEAVSKHCPVLEYFPIRDLDQHVYNKPRAAYVHRDDRHRSLYYHGPLKLLLGDLNFLNTWTCASRGAAYTVVYAGAGPGHHISFLARLFPACMFILYDTCTFAPHLPANVIVNQELFTKEIAAKFAADFPSEELVFISNIRTSRGSDYSADDMARQKEWAHAMLPKVAMLKFSLPWGEGKTDYLDGTLVFQPFSSQASTVTRIVVRRAQILSAEKTYDNLAYEEQLAYHNMIGRVRCYDHGVDLEGLDHCYDCSVFTAVIRDYVQLAHTSREAVLDSVLDSVARIVCDSSVAPIVCDSSVAPIVRHYMTEALSAIESSQYSRPRIVSKFSSATPRSDVRRWRAATHD